MLKIAFLVVFCGLVAQMAQTHPSNQYNMEMCPEIFNKYMAKQCPHDLILPLSKEVSTTTSGGQLLGSVTNLLPKELIDVQISLKTAPGRKLIMDIYGKVQVGGDFISAVSALTKLEFLASVHISITIGLDLGNNGVLSCGKLPNKDEIKVNVDVQLITGFEKFDKLIQPVLQELCAKLKLQIEANITSTMGQLVNILVDLLNKLLYGLTTPQLSDSKPAGCTHKIKDVNTDSPNIMVTVESTRILPGGKVISATEIPKPSPLPPANTDTGSQWMITEEQINNLFATLGTSPIEITTNLLPFSQALQAACADAPEITKVVLTPTQTPQIIITGGRIIGVLGGNLEMFSGPLKIVTASGNLNIDGRLEYKDPCVELITNFVGMGDVSVVEQAPGFNCDAIQGMDKEFTAIITGKAFIKTCVECSPAASLPPPSRTECIPMEGYAVIDHKKSN